MAVGSRQRNHHPGTAAAGRDIERDVAAVAEAMRSQPGIVEVKPFTKDESANCWSHGWAPDCRSTTCRCRASSSPGSQPGTVLDLAALRGRVTQVAPTASVDDHRAWIERMRSMTGATVFAGIGILALVIIATIISVSFATRGAMAANRPIVEVLHFVGAGDRYIANRFLRHFLRLGLQGGVIGGGVAMLLFGFSDRSPAGSPAPRSAISSRPCWGRFRCGRRAIWRWRRRRC